MKTQRIIAIILTTVAVLMVVASGVMKLTASENVVSQLTKVGVGKYIPVLGMMEIVFAALFVFRKTMKVGFILLSCYFAGAIATELSHGAPLNAVTVIVLVWVAAFLRDKSIFLPSASPTIA